MVTAGLHHITGIAGNARRNVEFYTRVLGLRMVKRTVNFDDPGTWHLYYGNETGAPGTALTFFLWESANRGRPGRGQAVDTAFAIPRSSVSFWIDRMADLGIPCDPPQQRFSETVLALRDPDGLPLELVGTDNAGGIPGWAGGPVAAEHAVRGFSGITLYLNDTEPTARVLEEVFGLTLAGSETSRQRYVAKNAVLGASIDLHHAPGALPGTTGSGTLHHIAFRASDDLQQDAMAERARGLGLRPTEQLNRQYFRSVYFREPGGVLFEIATDDPGFTIDEPVEALGSTLKLPVWLEARRSEIENSLPKLA